MRTLVALLVLAAAPTLALAEPPDRGTVLVGAKIGGLFPVENLDPAVAGGVEVGWVMPWLDRSLAAVLEVDYAQPTASGNAGDPRVGGASYDWKLLQRQLVVAPTVLYRLKGFAALTGLSWASRIVPYAGIGPRIYLLQSTVSGTAGGQGVAETKETATKVGLGVPLGAEVAFGPGSLTGELLAEWGKLETVAAGSGTTTAALSVRVGYRFVF